MMSEIPPKVALNLHIPLELCREILSRLPVKSLVRFRSVSKPWLSLISDPGFCRLHLKNFKNNRDETHLLVVQGWPIDWVVRCSKSFQSCASILPFLGCRLSEGSWRIKCCIDGLVLLNITYSRGSGREDQLVLWNPSIRKFHDIPSSPDIPSAYKKAEIGLGIGYDPLVKDYKYVKLIRTDPNIPPLVAVYTVGAGSWKIVPFQGNRFSDFVWYFDSLHSEGVCLQGNLYFLAVHLNKNVVELVWFDLSSEVFSSFSLPEEAAFIDEGYGVAFTELVRYGPSSLALLQHYDGAQMWVWESESMWLTQPYSMDLVMSNFLYLNKNSEILMWWEEEVSFNLGTSLGEVCCGLVSSYNLETRKEKILLLLPLEDNMDTFEMSEAYGYIESLLLLK